MPPEGIEGKEDIAVWRVSADLVSPLKTAAFTP
jgi:hypothetical protein